MSHGKYSPHLPKMDSYEFNCYGQVPAPWNKENYDEKTMFGNYDHEGFDSYGYSAFDTEGNYVGVGNGVDRDGLTEYEHLQAYNDAWREQYCTEQDYTELGPW